ncbi:MAG: ATP-binding protein [Bdellovibrionota bacterium]
MEQVPFAEKFRSLKKRPLLIEIFAEMAFLAVIEFALVSLILAFALGKERAQVQYNRAEGIARLLAADLTREGISEESLAGLRDQLEKASHGTGSTGDVKVALYAPGLGEKLIHGIDSPDEAPLHLLREALARGATTLPPSGLGEGIGLIPWTWAAAPIGSRGHSTLGSVLIGVSNPPFWGWVRDKWFLAIYVSLLLFMLLGLGAYRVQTLVVRPVGGLVAASQAVAAGARKVEFEEGATREFSALGHHLSLMTGQLLEREQALAARLAQLEKAQGELIQAEKMATIGRLASGIAHEVGNPLSVVSGYLEILSTPNLPEEERKDLLKRASGELGRADRIVRGLLDFSRPKKFDPRVLDLLALVGKVREMVKGQRILHNVEIVVEGDSVEAWADPGLVEQVLVNLLINAGDAMAGKGRVVIRTGQESFPARALSKAEEAMLELGEAIPRRHPRAGESAAVVRVQDTGPGIAPEHADKLFEPFFTTKEPGAGTGLGLAVSAQIASRQGGALMLSDRGGRISPAGLPQGACFELWLPLPEASRG